MTLGDNGANCTARRVRQVVAAGIGVMILGIAVAVGIGGEGYESERARNEARIVELEGQIDEMQQVPVADNLPERMAQLSEAAAADGQEVATAQQGFADLHHRASTEPDPGNGAPNEATLQIAEHGRSLAGLFDESTFLVDDEQAYAWTSLEPFDPDSEIDPRFAWYVRYDGATPSPAEASEWTVETVMPDLDEQDETGVTDAAQVVWLCRDTASGEVLAWANARYRYDGDSGVFDDLEVVMTSAGAEYQQNAGDGNGGDR